MQSKRKVYRKAILRWCRENVSLAVFKLSRFEGRSGDSYYLIHCQVRWCYTAQIALKFHRKKRQQRQQHKVAIFSGGSRGGAQGARSPPPHPLFLDQTEARTPGTGWWSNLYTVNGNSSETVSFETWIPAVSNFIATLINFYLGQFVKCRRIFLKLNFKGLYYPSSENEIESSYLMFTSSIKHEIRNFHEVGVQ